MRPYRLNNASTTAKTTIATAAKTPIAGETRSRRTCPRPLTFMAVASR